MKADIVHIGPVIKFCKENPILMHGKIIGTKRITPKPLEEITEDCDEFLEKVDEEKYNGEIL